MAYLFAFLLFLLVEPQKVAAKKNKNLAFSVDILRAVVTFFSVVTEIKDYCLYYYGCVGARRAGSI